MLLDHFGKSVRVKAMHSRRNTGISGVWKVVGVVAAIVILVSLAAWWASQYKPPTLEVSAVSLSPNEIKVKDSATLTFAIKNNDAIKPHSVKVVFNTTSPVTFYQNNISLPVANNGFQHLDITLQSGQQSTYPLKVTGSLTGGASTSTYSIRINFYDENSTNFDTETQSLKINS
jgi:hypothetical protein